jgi:microcystin-dependent protein
LKEVDTALLSTALTNNPGWQQHTTSSGCVIAGSDVNTNGPATAHTQGTLIGEESHILSVAELASHTHPEAFAAFTGAFQNGPQASGVYTAITPGTTGIAVSNTANTGSSSGHNTIQPTYYTWRLKKMY